jgi:hypothetical protein
MPNYHALAAAAARRYGLPVDIFLRQIQQESGFNPRARSSAGARGIAQFMPATARGMGVNPDNPRSALFGAARMDAQNLRQYGNWREVLSRYNSGRGWAQGRQIGETRNYVSSILGGRSPSAGAGAGPTSLTGPAPAAPDRSAKLALAQSLIAARQQTSRGETPDYSSMFSLVGAMRGSPPVRAERAAIAESNTTRGVRGGLRELFYDPLGAIKNGKQIAPIGGHRDHVHIATANAQEMVRAIQMAKAFGLSTSENPYVGVVHHVHVTDSNHYRVLGIVNGRKVGGATDVSGPARAMAAFYRWASHHLR